MGKGIAEATLKRFLRDFNYYGEACLSIRTKKATIETFRMKFAQRLIHEKLAAQYKKENRVRAIILKARQEGVSTYTAARFFRRLHLMPNQDALVLAHDKDTAQLLFRIYDRFSGFLPPEVKPMTRYVSKQTAMTFDNPDDKARGTRPGLGSSISIETANDPNAGRGGTYQMIHASEVAFWDKPEDVWVSLSQAVPDENSEFIVESTANGVGNFFHQQWLAAEEGQNGFIPIFLPWWVHEEYSLPLDEDGKDFVRSTMSDVERSYVDEGFMFEGQRFHLTLEQLAWRRQTIRDKLFGDERLFRQEYPATPEEAFLVSGNCFFDEDLLAKFDKTTKKPLIRANLVKIGSGVVHVKAQHGYVRVWELPKDDAVYVVAADTAMGLQISSRDSSLSDPNQERGGRDFSSADVLKVAETIKGELVPCRRQVAQLHGRMAPEVFAQQLYCLGYFYGSFVSPTTHTPSVIGVEKNHSSGETVLKVLQKEFRYPNLFYSRRINRRKDQIEDRLGWITSVETRMPMLDELARCIREETVDILCPDSVREMLTFVRNVDGKPEAQEGCHDDRVISLAIALQLASHAHIVRPKHYEEATQYATVGPSGTGLFDYE